uniref:Gag-pol polyprotein n=1 Tax=Solanum tuberosum TaxID=4113 RepID=M1DB14_SOLTU
MAPRRAYVRNNTGNDNVEPEVPHVLTDPFAKEVTHVKFQVTFQVLAQAMMAQANRDYNAPVNLNVGTVETRIRDFTRMNPLEFHNSKVYENPQEFIDNFSR